jgi:hypothetical protein
MGGDRKKEKGKERDIRREDGRRKEKREGERKRNIYHKGRWEETGKERIGKKGKERSERGMGGER